MDFSDRLTMLCEMKRFENQAGSIDIKMYYNYYLYFVLIIKIVGLC